MSREIARQVARRVTARGMPRVTQMSVLCAMAREPEATDMTLQEAWDAARIVTWHYRGDP